MMLHSALFMSDAVTAQSIDCCIQRQQGATQEHLIRQS